MINRLVNWLTDKRESSAESPVPENTGLPLLLSSSGSLSHTDLPLRSTYATMVRTSAYTEGVETSTQKISLESTWLLARCVGNLWDIISYTRKLKADGSFTTSAKIEKGNKGVTYAHVVCSLARYEHIRSNDMIIHKDNDVDQHTMAKHFIYVANHDGIGFDVEGNPHMSENGEFFTGEFSEEQRAAVYRFHHTPELQKLSEQSVVKEDFSENADLPLFDDINALKEVEILMEIRDFIQTLYIKRLNAIMTGKDSNIKVIGIQYPDFCDEEGEKLITKAMGIRRRLDSIENLSVIDKERIIQLFERIPAVHLMGHIRLLAIEGSIKFYATFTQGDKPGDYTYQYMSENNSKTISKELRKSKLVDLTQEFNEIGRTKDLHDLADNIDQIAGTERGRYLFSTELKNVVSICKMIEAEIGRLNASTLAQISKERVLVNDPQTGRPRNLTL